MNIPFSFCQPKNQAQTIKELKMKLELIIRIYYDVASFFAFSLFVLHVLCTILYTMYTVHVCDIIRCLGALFF